MGSICFCFAYRLTVIFHRNFYYMEPVMTHTLEGDSFHLEFADKRVLQDVYLSCKTGEVVGLLGRNGSGKSCMMKMIFGTLKGYYQSVRIDHKPIKNSNIHKGYIHYLPQENFIPGFLTVKEVLNHYEVSDSSFMDFFPEYETILRYKINTLSGGELRLLEVYIILCSKSMFSILDEPFSYLMPLHIEKVIKLIEEVKLTKGLIITDHMYKHILKISDHLYVLNNGKTTKVKKETDLVELGYLPE
jgi:ABC-type multidrug transport system ATPase subunit